MGDDRVGLFIGGAILSEIPDHLAEGDPLMAAVGVVIGLWCTIPAWRNLGKAVRP